MKREAPAAAELGAEVAETLLAQARKRIGSAWRAGTVAWGPRRAAQAIARGEAALVVVATDAASGAGKRIGKAASRAGLVPVEVGDRAALGTVAALGGGAVERDGVSVLAVRAGWPGVEEVAELCRLAAAARVPEAVQPEGLAGPTGSKTKGVSGRRSPRRGRQPGSQRRG